MEGDKGPILKSETVVKEEPASLFHEDPCLELEDAVCDNMAKTEPKCECFNVKPQESDVKLEVLDGEDFHFSELEVGGETESRSLIRAKLKSEKPKRYEEILEKDRLRSREYRQRCKEKWQNGPHTQEMIDKREREKEKRKIRDKRYRDAQKAKKSRTTMTSSTAMKASRTPKTSLKAMTEEERKEHQRKLKAGYRERLSAQKKRRLREQARERYYRKKKTALASNCTSLPPTPPGPSSSVLPPLLPPGPSSLAPSSSPGPSFPALPPLSPPGHSSGDNPPSTPSSQERLLTKKTHYNTRYAAKKTLRRAGPKQSAEIMAKLATPTTPEYRKAYKERLHPQSILGEDPLGENEEM